MIPEKNQKDLVDIPPDVRKQITFVPVATVDEAVAAAFARPARSRRVKGASKADEGRRPRA